MVGGEKGWMWVTAGSLARLSTLLTAPLSILAEREYRRMAHLPVGHVPHALPSLSIIVPARNEADNLPGLLDSLGKAQYPGEIECIVVDDASKDETVTVAKSYGANVLQLADPPLGWKGKTYACHVGAKAARGEWLLFLDADTRHAPDGPARTVSYAIRKELDGLSIFLPVEASGIIDRTALMMAYAAFFVTGPVDSGALNGQFILLHREAYEMSGGFSTVRDEVTEDLAFGNLLHRGGYRVPLVDGQGLGHVNMYQNVPDLWRGLARFSVASLRWSGPTGIISILFTVLVASPLHFAILALGYGQSYRAALNSWLANSLALAPWARRSGGYRWAILAPLGAALVQFAAIWGILRRLLRLGVPWKDRRV